MARPIGSKNITKPPKALLLTDNQRLEYIAKILLEIIEADIGGDLQS